MEDGSGGRRRSSFQADLDAADFLASIHDLGIEDENKLHANAAEDVHPFADDEYMGNDSGSNFLQEDIPTFQAHVSKPSTSNILLSAASQRLEGSSKSYTPTFMSMPTEGQVAVRAAEYKKQESDEAATTDRILAMHSDGVVDREIIFSQIKVDCGKCKGKDWDAHHPDCLKKNGARNLNKVEIFSRRNNRSERESHAYNNGSNALGCCGARRTSVGSLDTPTDKHVCKIT